MCTERASDTSQPLAPFCIQPIRVWGEIGGDNYFELEESTLEWVKVSGGRMECAEMERGVKEMAHRNRYT